MVGIIDYGVGNLFSLQSSFKGVEQEVFVSCDPERLAKADHLVLPGVGAFGDAAEKLRKSGMDEFVRQQAASGKPLMGVCLGMQLLFEKSYEYGEHPGLGILKGQVVPMAGRLPENLKIPHMGWNQLYKTNQNSVLLSDIREGDYVYFVHSYFVDGCQESLAAQTEYGRMLTAAVEKENIFGCQFHPEKSGSVGLQILRAFCNI